MDEFNRSVTVVIWYKVRYTFWDGPPLQARALFPFRLFAPVLCVPATVC